MKQQEFLQSIAKYFARFSEQVNILNKNGEFGINIHAENVLIKVLNVVFNCDFENMNYVEGKNYDSIDLRDKEGKLAVQITATSNIKKVKDTLIGYKTNGHYNSYRELKILILKGRQEKYSQEAIDKVTELQFHFDGGTDIIDFSTLYLLLNKQNDLAKLLVVKEILESQFSDIAIERTLPIVQSFEQLCAVLKPFFDENGHIFKMFGPNSGADGEGPLRWDLTLWYKSRREKIFPNNRSLSALISEYSGIIPEEFKAIFEAFQAHSYAFEKHCENANFDYSLHRFPKLITAVINRFANG